jgi:DNA-binding transcriptional ArsR family regulator
MTYVEAAYEKAFAALADPSRRQVFERLREGPLSVGDIARDMPVSRPAVSQHLKVLKEAGLVTDRAEGTRRIYAIDPQGLAALRSWLDQFWGEVLVAFAAEAERNPKPENPTPKNPKPKKGDEP